MRITNTGVNSARSPLVLYKRDASPPSNAVRMVGALLGLQFQFKEPDLLNLEHRTEEFKKINPMSSIPVLQDGDFIFAESHAIILYLVNKYGGEHKATLYPFDPQTRAVVNQCLHFDTGVMFRRLQDVAKPTLLAKKPGPTEEDISHIDDAYASLEAFLDGRRYVACDHLTIADVSLGSTVTAMQWIHAMDAERFPKSKSWLERVEAEPVFREINEHGATAFGKVMQHFWAINKNSLVLWKHDLSPPSSAVRMLAAILGLQFQLEDTNLPAREHKTPQFTKINPMSTVPVLKDGDFFISDSHAIMLYLLRKYGGDHKEMLYPSELQTRARIDQALYYDTGVVFRQLHDVIRARFHGTITGSKRTHIEQISGVYSVLEAWLENRPYIAADHVTVADISLGASVVALQGVHVIDPEKFPITRDWLDRMEAESYFKDIGTPCAVRLAAILNTRW